MKKARIIFFIIALLASLYMPFDCSALNYYVDASNNGTATGGQLTPWKTLNQVQSNMASFQPGDNIFFKCGETFTGRLDITRSGTAGSPITFGSYGTGQPPKFTGNGTTNITSLFYLDNRSYVTFQNLWVDDPTIDSSDHSIMSNIERAFYLDGTSNNIIITTCRINRVGVGVFLVGGSNRILNNSIGNLRMVVNTPGGFDDYGANPVVLSSAGNWIMNNYFYDAWAFSSDFTFDGGAVEFFGPGTNNNLVYYNTMQNCNGLMEFGSSDGGSSTGNVIAFNKLINNGSLFYINNSGPFSITVTNLQVYHNTIVETVAQRLNESYLASMASGSSTPGIIFLKNNIFWLTTGIDVARSGQLTGSNMVHEGNTYKLGAESVLNFTLNSNEQIIGNTVSLFKNTSGSAYNWDYNLLPGCPAIDYCSYLGITPDAAGNAVANPSDAGAFQYTSGSSPVRIFGLRFAGL